MEAYGSRTSSTSASKRRRAHLRYSGLRVTFRRTDSPVRVGDAVSPRGALGAAAPAADPASHLASSQSHENLCLSDGP
eukprot:scaffold5892_cov112-Isochrysis_galbana.AAC.4